MTATRSRLRTMFPLLPVVVCTGLAGCGGEKLTAPTSYAQFKASDGAFQCDYPSGWESRSAAGQGVMSAGVFKKGGALIDVTADLQGSLMGDIARSTGNMMGGGDGPTKSPVEKVHDLGRGEAAGNIKNYDEQPSKPLQTQMGEARLSEFTGGGGFLSSKVRGYRVTILGGERRIAILCKSPESDWATLQPAFQRVILSVRPGGG